jgi:non-ribosomal peptide synthetase-like protein
MKKLLSALMADPICNAIMSILVYAFYGAVIGISLTPSAFFIYTMYKIVPPTSLLNVFLLALCIGASVYMFFIVALIVFAIFERILTIGFKPGRYSTSSPLFARWIVYSGLHVILLNMVLPYVSGTVWNRLFYKILGAKIGKNVFINSPKLSDAYLLELGDNVVIGGDASISCHIFEGDKLILGNIKIGSNTLIGAETYIMPGATIGNNCNIGLKATVRKNKEIPDKSMILAFPGTPAKKIAEILKKED